MSPLAAGSNPFKGYRALIKPRTPADIGRDIADHEAAIKRLKAELADVPPRTLEIFSTLARTPARFERAVDVASIQVGYGVAAEYDAESLGKLRDWLNYYYPKEG